jgi:hypothetical protein
MNGRDLSEALVVRGGITLERILKEQGWEVADWIHLFEERDQ